MHTGYWQDLVLVRAASDPRPDILTGDAGLAWARCDCGEPTQYRYLSPSFAVDSVDDFFAWMEILVSGTCCNACCKPLHEVQVRFATWLTDSRLELLMALDGGHRHVALCARAGEPCEVVRSDPRLAEVAASSATRRSALDLELTDEARLQAMAGVVQRHGEYAPALREQARCLRLLERRVEACEMAERAVVAAPHEADGWFVLGDALDETFDYDGALFAYACCIQLDSRHADAHNQRGLVLKRVGRLAEAEAAYVKALEASPTHPAALNNLAAMAIQEERFDEALEMLSQVRIDDLCDDDPTLRLSLYHGASAVARRMATETRWEAALRGYELACGFHEEPPSAWFGQARCHVELGQWTAALAAVHRTLSLDPSWPGARQMLALCREVFGGRRRE